MADDDVDDHEDFAASHGAPLQQFAEQLTGDPDAASALVDAALSDVWAERHRLDSPEWPAFARERVARRWARRSGWPTSIAEEPVDQAARPTTDAIVAAGHVMATRRGLMVAGATGVAALGGALWQSLATAGRGSRVLVDGFALDVSSPQGDPTGPVVRISRRGDLLAEFATARERPMTSITPLPDGRDLVAVWLRGEVEAVDLVGAGSEPVMPTTLVHPGHGTLALAIGRAVGRLPVVTYLSDPGYRSEPPRVPQALVDWSPHRITGYFAPQTGVFVLQKPHREVLVGRGENQATVFLADIGAETQLLVVQSWSLVAATLSRDGAPLPALRQVFQNGALVCALLEPPASPAHPVDVVVVGVNGLVSIRVVGR
ncbi:hypothetical protein [Aestuariimicrobium sp. T2.26MG-19.2B]|uniref:hypothetical protein n=1 Tax=Aestuariimicrobium sp. T2.26MG-19.2B TaxID=3040679 RepID=UPI002477BBF4|nr:hypothetical protein [Aestuariimicrobium sp. T2.26MG-19.2B]CAI9408400.1 hypothetical protein AESSP_02023 [Aestuariimicrobium sp. T2.26MG-19.2B]